ncbi:uncharacterized protein SPPG_01665 [Spizellomyces punctatus DAOM BR117]|uniref:Extracellular metalloproteinase n=1 Tax=Spizellomyces punctatus (strain DAOM BR117) TaxID=645134 RepID=A0A0L0HTP2_SPIPD|nr:uncharacterized protein SPPG_01665 [Spizellomyces punctatus DAOM BR117]KND04234.1 hypothetical protein SPPG_01665 [Spizellomyces punctatus DAOM BR117]|eukprot:XP_016612273.1 hypothetical protein SPPG_01665 [Spizellomyces punctatus DAOM BR117]
MVKFATSTALVAAALASSALTVLAAPAPTTQSVDIPSFQRDPAYAVYGKGTAAPPSFGPVDDKTAALSHISEQTGVPVGELEVTDDYSSANGVRHIYVKRVLNGYRIGNQVGNISVKDGKILSFGNSFAPANNFAPPTIDEPTAKVNAQQAIQTAEKALGLKANSIKPFNRYVESSDSKYEFAWTFQVQSAPGAKDLKWYEVDVSAKTGKIISVTNWVKDASYTVADFRGADPTKQIITVKDPANAVASPKGWHNDGTTAFTETRGNNAFAYNSSGGSKVTAKGGAQNNYNTKYDVNANANTASNKQAAIANVFYVANSMHDLFYQYGFNEAAGNFQVSNNGKGGRGNDAVSISAQDPNGTNNANFATPPDGQTPQMNMYVFTSTKPTRDGDLENDIPIHEYTHGISNRLTGGPANSNCLRTTEAGGMGEGWSDTAALFVQRRATHTRDTDLVMGDWVTGNPRGIRTQPYSTSLQRNTLKYSTVGRLNEVHAIGEVWATIWNEVYWNLVDQSGFSDDIFNANQEKGNIVAFQLFVDSLALQPCNPTMIAARDAILQADENRYDGKYKCAIWKGFAKRGMGANATTSKVDDFTLPAGC